MEKRAFRRATALATILQCLMVLAGLAFPPVAKANLYPIVGTLLAVLAGWLFALWSPGRVFLPALIGGALAGCLSSFLGVLLAVLISQADLVSALIATLTGCGAGAVGGFLGRLFGRPVTA